MENISIRELVSKSGLKYKAIAKEMGISPEWLSKLMRYELTVKNREKILQAITALKEARDD